MMGKRPKLFWWKGILVFLFSFSFLFSQFLGFFAESVFAAAQTYDMASLSNYNFRFDGAVSGDWLSLATMKTVDLNNNDKPDILVGTYQGDNNSRTDSGSLYIIYDSLIDDYSGTGNTIDLASSANYNLRYDGAAANDLLTDWGLAVVDLNNNGKPDIIVGASRTDNNSRTDSGSLYIIYDSLIDDYSGTGNTIDLASSANYNLRYDGAAANDWLAEHALSVVDVNDNNKPDILVGAIKTDNNSRSNSGSLYVIYDSLIDDYSGTGNTIDLASSANYNLRYDGAAANVIFPYDSPIVVDLNDNGRPDILGGAYCSEKCSRAYSGSLYVIYDSLIDDYSGTGNTIDLASSVNYNLRYDGAAAFDQLTYGATITTIDLNNNNKFDILVGAPTTDNNSRADSGSLYVIYDSLIDDYSGTGNTIDLAISSNYNLRYDGAITGDYLSYFGLLAFDFFGTGKNDILITSIYEDNNNRSNSGSVYIISNSSVNSYSGTGNSIDMANSTNYTLRYDGATANDRLATFREMPVDLNSDGAKDLIFSSYYTDNNSRTDSGSLFIIYNFPHAFSLDSLPEYSRDCKPKITGNILAPNSVLNPYNVQFQVDASAFYGTWTECPADDSSYDTKDVAEKFTCQLTTALAEGVHKVYIRASDSNGSYTARHKVAFINTDLTGPSVTLAQVDSKTFKENTNLTNFTPTFFGRITDSLSQSLASGPREVKVELKKKDSKASYQTQEIKTLTLTQNYWEADNTKITDNTQNTSNKYSTFSYTPSIKLSVGGYQLTLTGKDKADNQGSSQTYTFRINQRGEKTQQESNEAREERETEPTKESESILESEPSPIILPIKPQSGLLPLIRSFVARILRWIKRL